LRQVIMEITVRIPKQTPNKSNNESDENYRTKKAKNKKKNKQAKAAKEKKETEQNEEEAKQETAEGPEESRNEESKDSEESQETETLDYTEEKLFHCVMPCNKGKAAIFTFPKEYAVSATVMIMGLIPYTKHLYGDNAKKWFGWNALGREDGSRWCDKTQSVISPNDEIVKSALQNDLWWMKDDLATGIEDQDDPLALPNRPAHDLGRNETIANERQINTGSLVTFANQINIRTYDTNSQAGSTIATTFKEQQGSDEESESSSDEEITTEPRDSESEDEENEVEDAAKGSGSKSSSSNSSQPSGNGTSEDEDHSDNSENDRLVEMLLTPAIRRRLLREAKKSPMPPNKEKHNKTTRKTRNKKELTPTKSALRKSTANEVTPPKLAGKTGQQRARKASTSGGRGAGEAR
jgi:hypothetical protein